MPVPALDQPAIYARAEEEALFHLSPEEHTASAPRFSARLYVPHQRTNRSEDLSIAKAKFLSTVASANEDLVRYSRFSRGWDGYDGEPIAPSAIHTASFLIEHLRRRSPERQLVDIIPGPASDGSLDLELHAHNRKLIITIYPGRTPDEVEVRTLRTDGVTSEGKDDIEFDALEADIRWVLS